MEIDRNGLEEQFDMNSIDDFDNLRPINADDPEDVIKSNIERADRILNILERELLGGNITARMMEVAAGLINSVTASSKELITSNNYKRYLQIKKEMLKYKYDELEWKKNKKEQPANQNLIVASREDILKIIGKQPEIKKLEQ